MRRYPKRTSERKEKKSCGDDGDGCEKRDCFNVAACFYSSVLRGGCWVLGKSHRLKLVIKLGTWGLVESLLLCMLRNFHKKRIFK